MMDFLAEYCGLEAKINLKSLTLSALLSILVDCIITLIICITLNCKYNHMYNYEIMIKQRFSGNFNDPLPSQFFP